MSSRKRDSDCSSTAEIYSRRTAAAQASARCSFHCSPCCTVVYQPPLAEKTGRIVERVMHNLQSNRFSISEVITKDLQPAPAVCLTASVE